MPPPRYPPTTYPKGNPGVRGTAGGPRPVKPKPKPTKTKTTKTKTVVDPTLAALAPLTAKQIAARARADVYPAANAEVDALTAELARRSKAGMGAIGGYANMLATSLGGYADKAGGIYSGAEQSQAAVDAALKANLSGAGGQLGDELAAKLAQINAPGAQVNDVAGGARGIGIASGNTQFALGSNELGRLVGESAASQDYAAKQPGIARFGGLAAGKDLQLQLNQQLADKSGAIRAQAASDYASAVKGYTTDEIDKALGSLTQQGRNYATDVGAASDAAKRGVDAAKVNQTAADKEADRKARITIAKENNATRERIAAGNRAAATAKASATAAAKQTAAAEKAAKTAASDRKARAKDFYSVRQKAFRDAAADIGAGHSVADTRAALEANYKQMLLGKGFTEAQVNQMISNAIKAGVAAPHKTGKSSSGGKTGAGAGLVP